MLTQNFVRLSIKNIFPDLRNFSPAVYKDRQRDRWIGRYRLVDSIDRWIDGSIF